MTFSRNSRHAEAIVAYFRILHTIPEKYITRLTIRQLQSCFKITGKST